jgi:ribosome-binding factor A
MPSPIRSNASKTAFSRRLSELLIQEINDPRLKQIFVTSVKMDRELAYAEVYVSAVEGASRAPPKFWLDSNRLPASSGGSLSCHEWNCVRFPRLRFHWDPTPETPTISKRFLQN